MDQDRPLEKIDVTNSVHGKFDQGCMALYLNEDKIGRIVFTNQGNQYEFAEGFEFDQDKIYQYQRQMETNGKYVEDCDLGWC
ncbi:DUF2553 family protein [Pseudalkalibacillus caeni]|uniref:DUF2553 family protein n=2 Tax=Exobacillus caeni TaxID=2574798 RepID=A0A5R9FFK9_9BACL|nr:DUF2553 family protein [Pseudalkalibacillus caeni]